MDDDRCQAGTCRQTWTRETPRGRRCELHAHAASPAPRQEPPAWVPRPSPPAPVRAAPRRPVEELERNPEPTPGLCCALRDGKPCGRPPMTRGLCCSCYEAARFRGLVDAVGNPPAGPGRRGPRVDHELGAELARAGRTKEEIAAALGCSPHTVAGYYRAWRAA